ncbi:potassium channel family protein [Gordonia sp. (in: high G+C Gram-positive bacteria)]|uniref:potassium channel family protein n=1 Tax=Gordonia sp. (in: high G+C Gram-positive bacteria) TaxID=84139 RepID=UPI003C72304D
MANRQELPTVDRMSVVALLRPFGAMIVLLVGYFLLPIGRDDDWRLTGMIAGGCLLAAFCLREIRHFARERTRPVEAAVEMLAAVLCFYLVSFATTYFLLSEYGVGSFTERLTQVDALHFCLTVFTTTGFGDITAASQGARIAVSIQMASTLILLGLGIRFVNIVVKDRISGRKRLREYQRRSVQADFDD